jgi:hypothetical protein
MSLPADQLECATAKRMEGMSDPHHLAGRTRLACSRRTLSKAKVEVAVQVVTRFIIAKLRNRNRQFFSLSALNAAIADLLAQINDRMSHHLGVGRHTTD